MIALLLALLSTAAAGGLTLTVQADGVPNQNGQLLFAIFDREEAWLQPGGAVQYRALSPSGASATVTFSDLPPGTYAVSVLHDENNNKTLDMRWLPYPRPAESAGVSNDAPASFGPPTYQDAAFSLREDARIVVNLRK